MRGKGGLLLSVGVLLLALWITWPQYEVWSATDPMPATPKTGETSAANVPSDVPEDISRKEVPAAEPGSEPTHDPVAAATSGDPAPRWHNLRIVTEGGRPIARASIGRRMFLFADGTYRSKGALVQTDRNGRARIELADDSWICAIAPGFEVASDRTPPGDGEWTIALRAALRLELTLTGPTDRDGYYARVQFPNGFGKGRFRQDRYEDTPGRAVDGTKARWVTKRASNAPPIESRRAWHVTFGPSGHAVLDQIDAKGAAHVELCYFDQVLDERRIATRDDGLPVRVDFLVSPERGLQGRVVDTRGRPLPGGLLRMAPYGGTRFVQDGPWSWSGFPMWAPRTSTDGDGRFRLPRPLDGEERVVITCPDHAACAMTVAEIEAFDGRIELPPGRTVRLRVVDCNGEPLDGGYSTSGHQYEDAGVLLGHDVWRSTANYRLPWFTFAELPPGKVTFRSAGEDLVHDTRILEAFLQTTDPVESMGIGK